MKDTLYAVISIFFKTILFFLCIMIVVVLSPSPRFPGAMPSAEYFLQRISLWGNEAFFAALFLALVSTHFRIIRRPGKKPLTFALVPVAAFCILYFGLFGLDRLFQGFETAADTAEADIPLEANLVERSGSVFVWLGREDDAGRKDFSAARPVVVMNRKEGSGNFRVYPEAVFDAKSKALKLSEGENIPLTNEGPAYIAPFMRSFMVALEYANAIVRPKSLLDLEALCGMLSFVFFGFSLWTLAKLSRWPLFNLWFTLAIIWLVFAGTRFLGVYIVPELVRFETLAWAVKLLPPAFPGVCGIVLFTAGLLGRSLEEWNREMHYE